MSFPVLFDRPRKRASFFLIKDDFLTADAAPLATPVPADPGPGTRTVLQPTSGLEISGGVLNATVVGSGSTGDTYVIYELLPLKAGRAYLYRITAVSSLVYPCIVDGSGTLTPRIEAVPSTPSNIREVAGGASIAGVMPTSTLLPWTLWMVRRASGGIFFGLNTQLAWVGVVPTLTSLQARLERRTVGTTWSCDYVRVADLALKYSVWDGDYGIASQQVAGTVTPGQTFTHEGDCLIDWVQTTLPSAGTVDVRFRKQDATNYWQLLITSLGVTTLNEVVAGVPVVRATVGGIANGDRILIRATDTQIDLYKTTGTTSSRLWFYSPANNFKTETDGEYTGAGTGGVMTNLVIWPRTLSGDALAALTEAQA